MTKTKKTGIGVGVLILSLIIGIFLTQTNELEETNYFMSETELTEAAVDWNYYDLLKNIDEMEGTLIHFTGTVNVASENGVFGINVGESSIRADILFVEYDKEQFVKRNNVEGFGYVEGIRNVERTNTVGGTADILEQVPNIKAIRVTCSNC